MNTLQQLQTSYTQMWERLAPRERRLIAAGLVLVTLALVWWLAIAPAVQTWRDSEAAHAKLDAQILQMQTLAAQAATLKAIPPLSRSDMLKNLERSSQTLGKAVVTVQANRVQVSMSGVSPEALAAWLSEVRHSVRLLAAQANWKKVGALWDGTTVFELPE